MYAFCELMILYVLGIIFFQEIRRNVKYGGSQRTQPTAHGLVGGIHSF